MFILFKLYQRVKMNQLFYSFSYYDGDTLIFYRNLKFGLIPSNLNEKNVI